MNIGIDIGGTHTRIATGNLGKVDKKFDFPTLEFKETLREIVSRVREVAGDQKAQVGVAIPGPIETKTGLLRALPNLPTWRDQPLREILSQELDLEVKVEHDASLAALAESLYGSGKEKDPVLYYTVSTGIGTGLVAGGQIYKGVYNPEGGQQIVTGVNKNLEKLSSGTGLKELYGKDPAEIVGTPDWDKVLERLARGITNSIVHFSPEVVIIGGGLTTNKEAFFEPLVEKIRDFLTIYPLPLIAIPALGADSTLVGAVELASQDS
ncbi:MAG: ROK family protein [bacterium]|nr:ROK family protein [bacterium]